MDWSALEGVLRCQPGYEGLHLVTLVLGGIASSATIIGALYALWALVDRAPADSSYGG
jgi:hypothetical protein